MMRAHTLRGSTALLALTTLILPALSARADANTAPNTAQPGPAAISAHAGQIMGGTGHPDSDQPDSRVASQTGLITSTTQRTTSSASPSPITGQAEPAASTGQPASTTANASPPNATTQRDILPLMRPEQRGLMIFQQVCSSCHSMERAHYGDMITLQPSASALQHWAQQRHGGLESPIASPYPSEAVGKANNGGDYPPDLSHIARTIKGGPDYIRAMLAGYRPTPPGITLAPHTYYNPVALTHHHRFKMWPPLHEGMMTFPDGTKATIPQMAGDVTAFLQWADDAHARNRHFIGTAVLLYLAVLGAFLFALWRVVKKEG